MIRDVEHPTMACLYERKCVNNDVVLHMSYLSHPLVRAAGLLSLGAFVTFGPASAFAQTHTNATVRVMASNLSSGNDQRYESPGLNILKGLKPDIVAMQEFNVSNSFGINTPAALSNMVATTLGTNFVYFRESGAGYTIPNGIISRHPFVASGSWVDSDTGVNDRGFAWAQIDLPGTNNLYVVSVHLKAGDKTSAPSDASRRAAQAAELKALISTNFPANAWIIVAGDFNLYTETEVAITTLETFLSDSPVPADQNGGTNTNAGRSERYDRVLPSFTLTNLLIGVQMPSRSYASGLVFDSRVYTPLTDVPPVVSTDSGALNMQHMGVVKDFLIPYTLTNAAIAPVITNQPQSLTITQNNDATFTVLAGGTTPLSYQWRFGSTNIAGATTNSYTRGNAQTNHEGEYRVVITNSAGSVTSEVASLIVLVPPNITAPPQELTVNQGESATFSVSASGKPVPVYQWRFNGTNLASETASSLTRTNVQPFHVGDYSVIVSNAAGSVPSTNAALRLNVPAPSLALSTAGLLQWQGLSNLTYSIQNRTNLALGDWQTLGSTASPNGTLVFPLPDTNAPQNFFRVAYP